MRPAKQVIYCDFACISAVAKRIEQQVFSLIQKRTKYGEARVPLYLCPCKPFWADGARVIAAEVQKVRCVPRMRNETT